MTLIPGTKLGPYEIVSPLGAGGMGEVYRARDTRLGREVAVKVLPQHLSSNAEVRARFEREAKSVSSLNHPHICVLHDVGREGDTDYLVMELIEGETLAARIAKGAVPVADVLKIGAQVADALDRAHRAGVVHRDLKPGNIMLTKGGAKLMDFGLARATGLAGSSASGATALTHSPTVGQPLTAEGTIVGTFQYMSPEQLEGRETDARSDIWAFGCVLYEMATGKRAFDGSTQASLISSIMRDQPRAMSEIAPMSPASLERLVRQCLAKDATERWQSAGDLRRELEWIASSSSQSAAPAVSGRRRGLPRGAAGLFAGVVVAAAALAYAFGPWRHAAPADAPLVRFEMRAPAGTTFKSVAEAEISPDGGTIVFVAVDTAGVHRLYLRSLSHTDARVVSGSDGAELPFWSPDGRMIGYFAGGKMFKVALDGSAPIALCDAPDARGGAWSPDGVIVFAPGNMGTLSRVSANGGSPVEVTRINAERGERGHRYPQFLPDGKRFLYVGVGADDDVITWAASIDGGEAVEVCKAGSVGRWAPPGWLLHLDVVPGVANQNRLLARRFDPASLRTAGDSELVLAPTSASNFGYPNASADARGTLVVQHNELPRVRISWMDRSGRITGVAAENLQVMGGALSPDGGRFAFASREPRDIFVMDLASGVSTRVTFENKLVNNLVWSPDGRTIAFARITDKAGWNVCTKSIDGAGADSVLFRGPGMFNYPSAWSRDGRWLVAQCADAEGNFDIWKVPMEGGAPAAYQRTPAQESDISLSPDDRWILYHAGGDATTEIFVQSFPDPGAKYQLSLPDAVGAVWSRAGNEIFALNEQRELFSIRVSTEGGWKQGATTRLFRVPRSVDVNDVTPDGNSFMVSTVTNLSALSHLEVVLNWTHLLQKAE
jgi:Tol biopolymer transport system component